MKMRLNLIVCLVISLLAVGTLPQVPDTKRPTLLVDCNDVITAKKRSTYWMAY